MDSEVCGFDRTLHNEMMRPGDCPKGPDYRELTEQLVQKLRFLRPNVSDTETQVQDAVASLLASLDIPFLREAKIGPGSRIDFLVWGHIGLEVKKGKPNAVKVRRQLERYSNSGVLRRLILLSVRGLSTPPPSVVSNMPVHYISLMRERGLAI
jgi:hypothetical protein